MDYAIREMREEEYPLLKEEEMEEFCSDFSGWLITKGFGRGICDRAWAAEADGRVIGAVWTRIMEDYGHIDEQTPSLAIAVFAPWRGRGVGMALMQRMFSALEKSGYGRGSLSVQKANAALHLYRRLGFLVIRESGEEYIMEKRLETETHTVL